MWNSINGLWMRILPLTLGVSVHSSIVHYFSSTKWAKPLLLRNPSDISLYDSGGILWKEILNGSYIINNNTFLPQTWVYSSMNILSTKIFLLNI